MKVFVYLLVLVSFRYAQAETVFCKAGTELNATSLAVPARSVTLNGSAGNPCVINGDLTLTGSASVTFVSADVTLKGSLKLADSAVLTVSGGSFNLANRSMFEYSIEARGSSTINLTSMTLWLNAAKAGNSLNSYYHGYDRSRLIIKNSKIDSKLSWLLANLHDSAVLESEFTSGLPNETYPYDSSTVRVGQHSSMGIWFDFPSGSTALLENLPAADINHPVYFSFGRNTPHLTNVKWQIDVAGGYIGTGIASHPGSRITIKNNIQPLPINYHFDGAIASGQTAPQISGLTPDTVVTKTFTDSGRVLELVNAKLNPYAWQVYAGENHGIPVVISNSTINEMAAMAAGGFSVYNSSFTFAGIASMGGNSFIDIQKSPSIESQIIMSDGNGVMRIDSSTIYGSLFQAQGQSLILLINNTYTYNKRNIYMPAYAKVRFITGATGGTIVGAGIKTVPAIKRGATFGFTGDAFVESKVVSQCTYNLSYSNLYDAGTAPVSIVRQAPCGKKSWNGDYLGWLNTSAIPVGTYSLKLEILMNGQVFKDATVTRYLFITQ